mmetsp:Transcript_31258/g.81436  ORF Transcript_31258/g.81436 Transcript_31258/m.81436 type:complete len:108 (-) Transcript_31258:4009-4332(-)
MHVCSVPLHQSMPAAHFCHSGPLFTMASHKYCLNYKGSAAGLSSTRCRAPEAMVIAAPLRLYTQSHDQPGQQGMTPGSTSRAPLVRIHQQVHQDCWKEAQQHHSPKA